ncbi:hypothetical protein Ciccas_004806 [Cichlidogyrus casuarinus]|uniref:Uncharacterized protein n=1 Tax=Cichlidogyrus casuarinus TaxID=1844966 RepID=A0ABD2QAI4_9PLAT
MIKAAPEREVSGALCVNWDGKWWSACQPRLQFPCQQMIRDVGAGTTPDMVLFALAIRHALRNCALHKRVIRLEQTLAAAATSSHANLPSKERYKSNPIICCRCCLVTCCPWLNDGRNKQPFANLSPATQQTKASPTQTRSLKSPVYLCILIVNFLNFARD